MPDNRVPRSDIIAAWLDPNLTAQQAAEKVGYKRRRALWVRAKVLGLPPRRLGRPPIIAGPIFEAMWRAGVMSREIARVFGGCAQPSISQAARNAGLPPRNKGPQTGGITLEEFAEMQVWGRMAATAAAEQAAMTDHRAIGRREALAYRIWAVAAPSGWNMTCTEIADIIDVPFHTVRRAVQTKNWGGRLPTRTMSYRNDNPLASGLMHHGFDGPTSLQKGDGVGGV